MAVDESGGARAPGIAWLSALCATLCLVGWIGGLVGVEATSTTAVSVSSQNVSTLPYTAPVGSIELDDGEDLDDGDREAAGGLIGRALIEVIGAPAPGTPAVTRTEYADAWRASGAASPRGPPKTA